jgi:hypothetical protein
MGVGCRHTASAEKPKKRSKALPGHSVYLHESPESQEP